MSNFDILFKNRSLPQIKQYQSAIRNIRKNARTKAQKINAINKQANYMNLMHNAGSELGGNNNIDTINNNNTLNFFKKQDIDYIFKSINVPSGQSKTAILGDVKEAYKVIKYLDFTKPKEMVYGPEYVAAESNHDDDNDLHDWIEWDENDDPIPTKGGPSHDSDDFSSDDDVLSDGLAPTKKKSHDSDDSDDSDIAVSTRKSRKKSKRKTKFAQPRSAYNKNGNLIKTHTGFSRKDLNKEDRATFDSKRSDRAKKVFLDMMAGHYAGLRRPAESADSFAAV